MKLIKKFFKLITGFFVIISLFLIFNFYNSPLNKMMDSVAFTVMQGESVRGVAKNLEEIGLIRSELFFTNLVRLEGKSKTIKSGQYNLNYGMKSTEILTILSRGIVATVKFTIPEGLHMKQIAELLEKKGIVKAQDFIEAGYNVSLLEKYSIPFNSAEGFFFPDTYIVAKDIDAYQLVEIMIKSFFENLHEIPYKNHSKDELKNIVIMASLVEREAKLDSERPLIAAVFYNRLKKGKRLESCATVQYILNKTKERLLYRDLKIDSPYNTYLYPGLPPGPIANPGIESLNSAIKPADVDYLFFVSKRDGSHYFSNNYQEHLRAIKKYNRTGSVTGQIS